MALAFLEPGLVAIGSETAIKSSIDAQLTAHSITSNDDMMELVSDIERGNNAWAVGRFDAIADQARLPEQIRSQIPAVKTFAVMSHIDGGVTGTLRAEARDDQAAENLRQVVQGFLALGRLQSQKDPKVAALLQSLQLSGTGKTVALSFAIPSEIFDMIPKAGGGAARHNDFIVEAPPGASCTARAAEAATTRQVETSRTYKEPAHGGPALCVHGLFSQLSSSSSAADR